MSVHILAVAVAVVTSFVISTVWYGAFGGLLGRLSPAYAEDGRRSPWVGVLELLRSAVLAIVVALACGRMAIDDAGEAVTVAVVGWLGFPVVLLSGAVLHERVPWRLAALHAGDWLLKLVAVTLIVGLWK